MVSVDNLAFTTCNPYLNTNRHAPRGLYLFIFAGWGEGVGKILKNYLFGGWWYSS